MTHWSFRRQVGFFLLLVVLLVLGASMVSAPEPPVHNPYDPDNATPYIESEGD